MLAQPCILIILLFLINFTTSVSIGRVQRARLLPGLRNQTAWLLNQTNVNVCLCTALRSYAFTQIAALNSFSSNFTCQLILSPPVLSPKIIFDNRSTLLLLQPLSDAPCCSDLAWLLERIKAAPRQSRTVVSNPNTLSINAANTLVSTLIYRGPYVRLHRNNMSIEGTYTIGTNRSCVTAIHRRGRLFFGCDHPGGLVIFNENILTSPITILNMDKYVRGVSFARNDSLMFVAVQRGIWSLYIYNINWTNNISTSLVQTLAPPFLQTWTTHTVNDTYVLLTSWDLNAPVYGIKSISETSTTWSMVPLTATKVQPSEYLGEAVVDPCGRMWVIANNFGIRIFDVSATVLLATWTLSTGLASILIFDNWEVLLSDYDFNYIYRFNPNIKCTS